jgi:hypothetical protein
VAATINSVCGSTSYPSGTSLTLVIVVLLTATCARTTSLTRLERPLLARLCSEARPGVQVKLLPQDGEFYVLAQSRDRVAKEWALRRRQLKWLWARLKQLAAVDLTREASSRLPFTL